MTGLEIWLLAIGLAMDCFAVSIASGIILKRTQWRPMLVMALAFGLFQALMPFIGWMFAKSFSHLIESIDHWIAFAILAFLGGRMILESFKAYLLHILKVSSVDPSFIIITSIFLYVWHTTLKIASSKKSGLLYVGIITETNGFVISLCFLKQSFLTI